MLQKIGWTPSNIQNPLRYNDLLKVTFYNGILVYCFEKYIQNLLYIEKVSKI